MHRLIHAGEIGGPENVYDAVEILGAERIGHGIAVMRDERVIDFLSSIRVPLEFPPMSNLRRGPSRQLGREPKGSQNILRPRLIRLRARRYTLTPTTPQC